MILRPVSHRITTENEDEDKTLPVPLERMDRRRFLDEYISPLETSLLSSEGRFESTIRAEHLSPISVSRLWSMREYRKPTHHIVLFQFIRLHSLVAVP